MAEDLKTATGWWRPSASHKIGSTPAADDGVSVEGHVGPTGTITATRGDEYGSDYMAVGPSQRHTYTVSVANIAYTANCMPIVVEAGSHIVHLVRVTVVFPGLIGTAAAVNFTIVRTTTAGSGGVVTPVAYDTSNPAFTGICRSMPTTMGTVGTTIQNFTLPVGKDISVVTPPATFEWAGLRLGQRPHANAGEGLAFYAPATAGATGLCVAFEFVEWDVPV